MSKYNSKKTIVDGITFDSIKESRRYSELKILKIAGEVDNFNLQPAFLLQEGFKRKDGKKIREIWYIADFEVWYKDGRREIEDVKGMETEVFKIKRKLFEAKYDLVLRVI
jgi:hypothetical protein